jgi:rod shape-determining protein MreC
MRPKRGKIVIAIFGILLIIFFISEFGKSSFPSEKSEGRIRNKNSFLNFFQDEVKNFFYSISLPFQKVLFKTGDNVSDFFKSVIKIKGLKIENEELNRKIREALGENVRLREIEQENNTLRKALNALPKNDFELFISHTASRDIINPDSILVTGGLENGILKGMPVITPERILVGRVNSVYKNFSEVSLISQKDFSFDVKISEGENSIYGLAEGKGNLGLYLDKVLLNAELKEKDLIITSSLGGIFPEGILVGEIRKVKKSDLEPFQQAEVSPYFDIKELETLFIITSR